MTEAGSVLDAAILAVLRHHGQMRKDGVTPYAVHPLRVARHVAGAAPPPGAARETCLIAALLHDTIEDTGWSRAEVAAAFGAEVAAIVAELTQEMHLAKPERRLRMIEKCGRMSPAARFVKLADRLDNLRDLEGQPDEFVHRYCLEAVEMVARMRGTCPELEEAILALVHRYRPELAGEAGHGL